MTLCFLRTTGTAASFAQPGGVTLPDWSSHSRIKGRNFFFFFCLHSKTENSLLATVTVFQDEKSSGDGQWWWLYNNGSEFNSTDLTIHFRTVKTVTSVVSVFSHYAFQTVKILMVGNFCSWVPNVNIKRTFPNPVPQVTNHKCIWT